MQAFVVSPALTLLSGESEPMPDRFIRELVCNAAEALRDGVIHAGSIDKFVRKDGTMLRLEFHVAPLADGTGAAALVTLRDVSELVAQRRELRRLSTVIEEIPALISTSDKDGNVTYFNRTGRKWLGIMDDKQPSDVRFTDATWRVVKEAARLGGDEFAVLCTRTTMEDAKRVAERLLQRFDQASGTVSARDPRLSLRASIGVATFPAAGATAEDILIHSDMAMYAAKQAGGHQAVVYDPEKHRALREKHIPIL